LIVFFGAFDLLSFGAFGWLADWLENQGFDQSPALSADQFKAKCRHR